MLTNGWDDKFLSYLIVQESNAAICLHKTCFADIGAALSLLFY